MVTDGTSDTMMLATGTAVIESIGTKYTMALPHAGKNEVAIETLDRPETAPER